jgi:predicted outer membrane protein
MPSVESGYAAGRIDDEASGQAAKRGRGMGVRGYAGPVLFDYVHEEGSKSTRPTNLAANASVKHFDSRNR